ncbi:MAG: hypothetical protein ACQEQI_01460 [Bacillota bacterium]
MELDNFKRSNSKVKIKGTHFQRNKDKLQEELTTNQESIYGSSELNVESLESSKETKLFEFDPSEDSDNSLVFEPQIQEVAIMDNCSQLKSNLEAVALQTESVANGLDEVVEEVQATEETQIEDTDSVLLNKIIIIFILKILIEKLPLED